MITYPQVMKYKTLLYSVTCTSFLSNGSEPKLWVKISNHAHKKSSLIVRTSNVYSLRHLLCLRSHRPSKQRVHADVSAFFSHFQNHTFVAHFSSFFQSCPKVFVPTPPPPYTSFQTATMSGHINHTDVLGDLWMPILSSTVSIVL